MLSRTAQISKEKQQSIITLRHAGQSIWKSARTSSAVAKTMKRYDETASHEDHHRKGRPRVTSTAEVTLSVIYLEFKAHLTSMATTIFCSDTPSHLVCA